MKSDAKVKLALWISRGGRTPEPVDCRSEILADSGTSRVAPANTNLRGWVAALCSDDLPLCGFTVVLVRPLVHRLLSVFVHMSPPRPPKLRERRRREFAVGHSTDNALGQLESEVVL